MASPAVNLRARKICSHYHYLLDSLLLTALLLPWTTASVNPLNPAAGFRIGPPTQADIPILLPDLRTLPPTGLKIQILGPGERELRLDNIFWNNGEGPLVLVGEVQAADRRTLVQQIVVDQNERELALPVGEFVWHPTHDHWHLEGFALYELWSLKPFGELDQVVSSSDKLSYCIMDTDVVDPRNPGYAPRRRYYACDKERQGLSVGWGDKYKSHLDGQSLDLTGVTDGYYALLSTANPDQTLLETNYSNNTAVVYIEIRGSRVAAFPLSELSEARCEENGWC